MTSENEDKGIDDGHRTLLRLCLPQRKKCLVCSKLKQVSKICSANNFAATFSIEMQFFLSVNYGQARRYLYASEMVSLINPNSTYFLALLHSTLLQMPPPIQLPVSDPNKSAFSPITKQSQSSSYLLASAYFFKYLLTSKLQYLCISITSTLLLLLLQFGTTMQYNIVFLLKLFRRKKAISTQVQYYLFFITGRNASTFGSCNDYHYKVVQKYASSFRIRTWQILNTKHYFRNTAYTENYEEMLQEVYEDNIWFSSEIHGHRKKMPRNMLSKLT